LPPSKSIAIPPNPGARRGQRIAPSGANPDSDDELAGSPSPAIRRPAQSVQAQPIHRFDVGERLRMAPGGFSVARAGATCKVVSLLPYEGHGSLLYRVRSDTEAFERVVAEADLSR
jgi:hypothetical protein